LYRNEKFQLVKEPHNQLKYNKAQKGQKYQVEDMVEYEDVLLQDSDLSQTQKVYYVGQCADYYEDYVNRLPALSPRVDQMNEHK
jgi:hypothetical protein